jgi:hypothetical protein
MHNMFIHNRHAANSHAHLLLKKYITKMHRGFTHLVSYTSTKNKQLCESVGAVLKCIPIEPSTNHALLRTSNVAPVRCVTLQLFSGGKYFVYASSGMKIHSILSAAYP